MPKARTLVYSAAISLWSGAAFAGEARLNTDSRGCYLIEVRSFDVRPTRVSVNYSLAGLPDSFYVDLQPQESRFVTIANGACLQLGDIKIGQVSTHVINANGSIGTDDLNRQTENLIEDFLRRNEEDEARNKEILERRRLAREARKQKELELKAARERSAAEAQRIFALGREQQLQEIRSRHPGCLIYLDTLQADLALCLQAERRIKEDELREAQLAEERAEQEKLAAANSARAGNAEALHNEYLAKAAASDRCWGYWNYAKYHPEPEKNAATRAQIEAALAQMKSICDVK